MASKFSRWNVLVSCRCCGKRTHSSIDGMGGIDLCRVCLESCGQENSHSDYGHDESRSDCPTCVGLSCLHLVKKATKR